MEIVNHTMSASCSMAPESRRSARFGLLFSRASTPLFSCERLIQDLLEIDEAIGSRIYQMAKHYTIEIREDKRKNIRLR